MAYKFQLGNAKLGGSLQQDGGITQTIITSGSLSGSLFDDTAAANVVSQIDAGEIPIEKLAAKTISGKDLGTALDALAVDDSSIEYSAGSAFNGSAPSSIRVKALGVTNGMLAGSIANAKLVNSTISGKALGTNLSDLTDGNGIADFTFNGSGAAVISLDLNGSSLNSTADGLSLNSVFVASDGLQDDSGKLAVQVQSNKGISVDGTGIAAVVDSGALELGASGINLKSSISGNRTFANDVTVTGNFTVNGTTTTLNVTQLEVEDNNILIRSGSAAADGSGITIGTSGTPVTLQMSDSAANLQSSVPLKATSFIGALNGNANSATELLNPRAIGGVNFNGTAAITPQQIDIQDEENQNADRLIMFADAAGAQRPKNDGDFHYNPSTGKVTAIAFAGDGSQLTGLSATQIAVALKADGDSLVAGFNHIADMSSDGTDVFTLPASPNAGDVVYVKAPSDCASGRIARIQRAGSQTIDGVTSIDLVSPHAAVSLVYVGSDAWKLF